MALFASGKTTGLVLSAGQGNAYVVPVFDGSVITSAVEKNNISGADLTKSMTNILSSTNEFVNEKEANTLAETLKIICSVSLDPTKLEESSTLLT